MGVDAEMFVRTMHKVTDEELKIWHYQFGCAFHRHLWLFDRDGKPPEEKFLFKVKVWEQDSPDIKPKRGETFLRLRPMTRYYGPGYERGDIMTLISIAAFLELLIPGSEVWYGGDSSGICAEKFGPDERRKMLEHFVKHQHNPYQRGFDSVFGGKKSPNPVCPYCDVSVTQFGGGGGGGYASYSCLGCGWKEVHHDGTVQKGWKVTNDI